MLSMQINLLNLYIFMYYTYPIPSNFEYVVPPSLGQTHIGISILVGCERNCSLIAQLHTAFVVILCSKV